MTEYELEAVYQAVMRSLELGGPRLSQVSRQAIANRVTLRLRHEFNVAMPKASQQLANIKAAFAEHDIPLPQQSPQEGKK